MLIPVTLDPVPTITADPPIPLLPESLLPTVNIPAVVLSVTVTIPIYPVLGAALIGFGGRF